MTLPWVLLPLLLLAGTRHVGGYTFKLHQTRPTPVEAEDRFFQINEEFLYTAVVVHPLPRTGHRSHMFDVCTYQQENKVMASFHYVGEISRDGVVSSSSNNYVRYFNSDTTIDYKFQEHRGIRKFLDCANYMAKANVTTFDFMKKRILFLPIGPWVCRSSVHQTTSLDTEPCTSITKSKRPTYVRVP